MPKNKLPKVTARWDNADELWLSDFYLAEIYKCPAGFFFETALLPADKYSMAKTKRTAKRRCEKWLTEQFAKMGIELEVVK